MPNPDSKVQKLLYILATSYYENRWISMEEIIDYTKMSSFNQRIQQMREAGIKVENRMEGGKSFYRLFTDPQSFRWTDYGAVVPRERIERHGRKVKRIEAQEILL